jgi:hypothetical protein
MYPGSMNSIWCRHLIETPSPYKNPHSTLFFRLGTLLPCSHHPTSTPTDFPCWLGHTLVYLSYFLASPSYFSALLHPICLWPVFLCHLSLSFSRQTILSFRRVPLSSSSHLTHSRRFTPRPQIPVAHWYVGTHFSLVLGYDEGLNTVRIELTLKLTQLAFKPIKMTTNQSWMNAFSFVSSMIL